MTENMKCSRDEGSQLIRSILWGNDWQEILLCYLPSTDLFIASLCLSSSFWFSVITFNLFHHIPPDSLHKLSIAPFGCQEWVNILFSRMLKKWRSVSRQISIDHGTTWSFRSKTSFPFYFIWASLSTPIFLLNSYPDVQCSTFQNMTHAVP